MAVDVSTTVTELPESRVRVQAEVPAAEVEKRLAQAARQLGRNLRVPGFRTGKVPPPVIIQRVGRDAVRALLDDPERARKMGEAAQQRVRDQFLGARSLLDYLDLVSRLLA